MASNRVRKLNERLRHLLAEAVARELTDPRVDGVTIVEVRAAPDLSNAKVFFTLRDPSRIAEAEAGLASARGLLQGRAGAGLSTRNTPHLDFEYDRHHDEATRLSLLIDEVTRDLPPLPVADPEAEPEG